MLRDFITSPDAHQLTTVLMQFKNIYPTDTNDEVVSLLGFRILTPDSFMWRLLIGECIYYLYAEDHIESLKDVADTIRFFANNDGSVFDFVETVAFTKIASAEPVRTDARYYSDEIKQYGVVSGYDLVFLSKTNEDYGDAYFAE